MNTLRVSHMMLAISIISASLTTAWSQMRVPKYASKNSSLYPASVQQEVHLARSLFAETNRIFDKKVFSLVRKDCQLPAIISFQLVSFVFSYPSTNGWPSGCEGGQPDQLLCTAEGVSRSSSTNEVPLNYVRIVNPHKKDITADLDLLLGVAPLNKPKEVRYFRRSLRFIYQDGWIEEP